MMKLQRLCLFYFLLCSMPAQADMVCPDFTKNATEFQLIARGTVKSIIEPVYEYGCESRNQYNQCEGPLEKKETILQRMIFEMDEIYYVNSGISSFFLTNPNMGGGSRAEELQGISHRTVIVGRKEMLGQKGLLSAYEKNETGDFNAASGCQSFTAESENGYKKLLESAKQLRQ